MVILIEGRNTVHQYFKNIFLIALPNELRDLRRWYTR